MSSNDDFVRHWIMSVGLDQPDWPPCADPDWVHRPSLHEMQLADALDLSYAIAVQKQRLTESLHHFVTRAIAHMVPVDQVSNEELLHILFGSEADMRSVRNFRNAERTLKLNIAAKYIQDLLYERKVAPAEGGRLWYVALVYASGIAVINEYLKQNGRVDAEAFARDKVFLIETGCEKFSALWVASLEKSQTLPGHSWDEIRGFMDYCAFVQWQESKVKRNPIVGIRVMASLAPSYNEFQFG